MPSYFFYILKCKDGTLYSGIAKNLDKRLALHNSGKGSAYVRSRGGGKIVYSETFREIGTALKREAAVKKFTRQEKLLLIRNSKKQKTAS